MTFDGYQTEAMKLRLDSAWDSNYARYGLVGEVGELASLLAKEIRDGRREDHNEMVKKELGDILWFLAAIATDNALILQDIAEANIEKLKSRRDRGVLQGSGDNR